MGKAKRRKEGKEHFQNFLRRKLELPVSWAWNGITPEEKRTYEVVLKEVNE